MPHFIFIQQISVLIISNMLYNLHFFSSKCRLFHNATLFGFCITHILNTGCAKIWKKIRRQKVNTYLHHTSPTCFGVSHTIFRENLLVTYSKPSAFTKTQITMLMRRNIRSVRITDKSGCLFRYVFLSVPQTVRMAQLGSHWKDFHGIRYLIIFFFRKSVELIRLFPKYDKNNGYFTRRCKYISDHIRLNSS